MCESLEPKEATYITADCGHEVFEGEKILNWNRGKGDHTICPDCFWDKVHDMTIEEVATLMDVEYQTVAGR